MKTLKTILILAIILFANTLQAQTSILAKEITINKSQISSSELIKTLQTETGFSINYSGSVLKIPKNIKLEKTTATFKYFLDKIFGQQQVEYIVKGQKILVKIKPNNKTNKTSQSKEHFINITGKVTEKQTGKPISYATISIKNQAIGTVTNTEGGFVFHVPKKYINDSLIVSSIGYKSYGIQIAQIKDSPLNIVLEKKIYDLSEIEVKPKDALEIVKQAIAKIPENYPSQPINMDGFYREMTFENDTCVEMAEAACNLYYRPYNESFNIKDAYKNFYADTKINFDEYYYSVFMFGYYAANPKDQMQIIEARASNLHHKHRFKVVPLSGPWELIGYDWLKQNLSFKNGGYLKKHRFKLIDITEYDGKQVYKIFVKPKSRTKTYHEILYIDIDTYAIAMIEYSYPGMKFKTNRYWTPALYKKKKRKSKDIEREKYFKVITKYKNTNGKWALSYIKRQNEFDYVFSKHYIHKENEPKISYKIQTELLINDIKTKNVQNIPDSIIYENFFYSVLSDYDLNYNKSFWESYNTVARTPVQDSIIKQLSEYQTIEQQFSEKFTKNDSLKAPVAKQETIVNPYTKIEDNYYWMQDNTNMEVLEYIEKENHFTKNYMLPLKQNKRNLFLEMIKRESKDTTKVTRKVKKGNYEYYYKKEKGANYANIYRKKIGNNSKEELILDIVKKSRLHPSYWAEITSIKPDNSILAYTEPITDGYDSRIVFKDLNTSKNIDSIDKVGNIIWMGKNNEFLYTNWNETNRVDKLYKHKIGTKQNKDELVYIEKNKLNNLNIYLCDEKYILLQSTNDFHNNDIYLIELNNAEARLNKIVLQTEGYSDMIQIKSDTLYSLSEEPNGKTILYYSPMDKPKRTEWKIITQNRDNTFFSGYKIRKNYIVIIEKENMQSRFRIIDKKGQTIKVLEFKDEESYKIGFKTTKDSLENKFKFYYTSLATPYKTYEYDIEKDLKRFIKQEEIKGYIAKHYKTKLLWATSKDGTKVPISLVYNKKRVRKNGKAPVLLYAYGSYGANTDPEFSSIKLSLLDRGIVYAIAHVRGGGELGAKWHEDAMQTKKKNTFYDFIACAEQLIKEKYTSKGKIVARGGSAGGLTMGAVANLRPDLFNTVVLESAYLNVLGSLTDSTAKFSSDSKGEEGDPGIPEVYDYIKSYSPYQNIKAQNYPNMLFCMGLNDTRVEYWQSLKTVAKLRALKTDTNTLLLKTDLYAGHNGYSGYYNFFDYDAFVYAFILDNLKIKY